MSKEYLSVQEFTRDYNVSRATLYRLLAAGSITARKMGRRTMLDAESIKLWQGSLGVFESQSEQKRMPPGSSERQVPIPTTRPVVFQGLADATNSITSVFEAARLLLAHELAAAKRDRRAPCAEAQRLRAAMGRWL